MEHLAKVHRFFGDPKFTVPCLMLSWRETLLSTSCGPSHGPGGRRAAGHHVGLLQVATAGSEQALGGLPGHWRAAAVPVQSSMGVNLVSRAGSHLGCGVPAGWGSSKMAILFCMCQCLSPER